MRMSYPKKVAAHCHSGLEPESRGKCWIPASAGMTRKRAGMTLPEMTVVIAIAAIMVGLTVPAINMLLNSFESESGAKSIISAALSSARSIAVKKQRYAGIRFQKRCNQDNPNSLNASQYIVFIIHDYDSIGYAYGFRAVDGIQPIKLPDSIGVMDSNAIDDASVSTDQKLRDNTTFSIVFSPSGKLVIQYVRAWNRDGNKTNNNSSDDIFNTDYNVQISQIAMFQQDDYPTLGFNQEPSRNSFYIYETKILKQTNQNRRWTDYLSRLNQVYINPYTGTIVNDK